jgi:hypothetical protein
MPRYLSVGFLLFQLFICSALAQDRAPALKETVTNQTIMDMVNAKLPPDLIVTKIQTSQTDFDLSTEALVKLNQAGVPPGYQGYDAKERGSGPGRAHARPG